MHVEHDNQSRTQRDYVHGLDVKVFASLEQFVPEWFGPQGFCKPFRHVCQGPQPLFSSTRLLLLGLLGSELWFITSFSLVRFLELVFWSLGVNSSL